MSIHDPRGSGPDDDPSGRTSVLPVFSSGLGGSDRGTGSAEDTRRFDFSGGGFGAPPDRAGEGWSRRQKAAVGLALVAMALGGGAAGAYVANALDDDTRPVAAAGPIVSTPPSASGADDANAANVTNVTNFAAVAKAVQPSVVSINVRSGRGGNGGSGVILDADGRILTNNHVVEAAAQGGEISVTFSDGRSARASIVGTDPLTDLAVVRAEGVSGLTPATLGDSDKLQVGEPVLALGSPLGLDGSVTAGIISALNRTIPVGDDRPGRGGAATITGAIQTDAAINPGNSGGALANASGQVIGINTAIITNGGDGNIGVGFAIPMNTAKKVADQLITTGRATHAFLGVGIADAMGSTGSVITAVEPGSPAERAGFRPGDRITKINDTEVTDSDTVTAMIRSFKPGDRVTLTYVRDGETRTVTVTLAERTAN